MLYRKAMSNLQLMPRGAVVQSARANRALPGQHVEMRAPVPVRTVGALPAGRVPGVGVGQTAAVTGTIIGVAVASIGISALMGAGNGALFGWLSDGKPGKGAKWGAIIGAGLGLLGTVPIALAAHAATTPPPQPIPSPSPTPGGLTP